MDQPNRELKTYAVDVLGCKVNQYDARQIARLLEGFGLRKAMTDDAADLVFVHSCGVTSTAVQKSRQALRRLVRRHPDATVFLTGCAAEEQLLGDLDGVNARIAAGSGWMQRIADALQPFDLPNPGFRLPSSADDLPAERFGGQTRAFLKIQDGCDAHCAYCIVPQLRKEPRDKPLDAVEAEARELVRSGYQEIVLAGVHVGLYGRESGVGLDQVLQRLARIPDLRRLRLSSLHPSELTDELLAVWASSPNVMPHLHLSLQSGSDGVLCRMGRGYTAQEYAEAVARARAVLDRPAVTTDVIVGFPGEADTEFEETMTFCREIGFADMHIFTFSPRPGTRAAEMPDPVPPVAAQSRQKKLAGLSRKMTDTYRRGFVGETVDVLTERFRGGSCSGMSMHYVPVRFPGSDVHLNNVVSVKAVGLEDGALVGEPVQAAR